MSKNVVDSVIEFSAGEHMVFIPSRRQIEWNGGYVNNWTTKEFVRYVKSKNPNILIERDHGGPGQGTIDDDGIESMKHDARYMDIIHIDPWKKYPQFEDGLQWTIDLITMCYEINPEIVYEIATEEGIRKFEVDELDRLVNELKTRLDSHVFSKIKYLVIQCGTRLTEKSNTGVFDEQRLRSMIELAKKHNLIAKEHNGDWISNEVVQSKSKYGLECINIAPEFGEIETRVILDRIKNDEILFEKFFNICYCLKKWEKWVTQTFKPLENKEQVILIAGHYVFTDPEFIIMKNKLLNIDSEIRCRIIDKLKTLK
jgi:hypothetical protein